jgi:two-component system chemotaxis response regulator CheB
MGRDGADELKTMKEMGALTLVQNEETSVVFGMPGEALRIGAADYALSPESIAVIISRSGLKK